MATRQAGRDLVEASGNGGGGVGGDFVWIPSSGGDLKVIAPRATYYWVDIGATMSNQVDGWNARNKTIYDNANALGYTVISRYKAIFGPTADPLRIQPGQNFPYSPTEPGYGGVGNIHGADAELSSAILEAVSSVAAVSNGCAVK